MSKNSKSHSKMNIGILFFAAIFIYMVAIIITYFTKDQIAFSEVQAGRIINSDTLTGFIIRDEAVIGSEASGYVNYYIGDAKMAAKNAGVCIIDSAKNNNNSSSTSNITITSSNYSDIREQLTTFKKNYQSSRYNDIYNLDYQLNNILNNIISQNNINQISIQSNSANYTLMNAAASGVVSYTIDGYEAYRRRDLSPDLFSNHNFDKKRIIAGTHLNRNDPAYKIIYDDRWEIILLPNEKQLEHFRQTETVDLVFNKDDIKTSADVDIFEIDGTTYVSLKLKDYMIRYCSDRYEEISVLWDNFDGLKIPASSVVTKNFYMIPQDYHITNESTNESGFYLETQTGPKLIKPVIYSQNDNYCYIDCNDIQPDAVLYNADHSKTFRVGSTAALKGVYNVNKGYSLFRLINVLYETSDYCIIDNDTRYGVTLYDRIILNGEKSYENQIIY